MNFYDDHRCHVEFDSTQLKKPVVNFLCQCGKRDFQHIPNPIREVTVECLACHKQYIVVLDHLELYNESK